MQERKEGTLDNNSDEGSTPVVFVCRKFGKLDWRQIENTGRRSDVVDVDVKNRMTMKFNETKRKEGEKGKNHFIFPLILDRLD